MAELTKIQLKTKTTGNDTTVNGNVDLAVVCNALEQGEPLFDKNTDRLYVGNDGSTTPAAEYLPSKGKNGEYEVTTITTEGEGGKATTTLKVETDNIDIDANVVTEGTSTFKDITTFEENLCAGSDSSVNIGASDKKFKDAYFTNVHGNVGTSTIYGKEMSGLFESTGAAKNATTSINLADSPSLSAYDNQIKVTAGNKTSEAFTVPFATTADKIKDGNNEYTALKEALLNMIYPVGSIYMSTSKVSPADFLGGTWVRWGQGRVPVGVNEFESEFESSEKALGAKIKTVSGVNAHTHYYTPSGNVASTFTGADDSYTDGGGKHKHDTDKDGNHKHNLYVKSDDGTGSISMVLGYDTGEKAKWKGDHCNYEGTHNHTVTYADAHSHKFTARGTVESTFTGTRETTESFGGKATVSVLQPYITCYMWKRTK